MIASSPSYAAIGDTTVGEWQDGNWYEEFEAADGSKYAIWIDEGGTSAAGNETGDYWYYQLSLDGSGGYTFVWDYNVLDLTETKTEVSNAATGYYMMDYYHEDNTGTAGAYYKEENQWSDPLSGSYDNYLEWYKDVDADGDWGWGEWYYEEWDWFYAGEGTMSSGWELWNWTGGIGEYESSWSSISGSYENESDRYWDTDLDDDWYDNYYTQSSSSYDAESGWQESSYFIRDRVNYDWWQYQSYTEEYLFSGEMSSWDRTQMDTDADGSISDYWSDGGAYYAYNSSSFDAEDNSSYSDSTIYDPFAHYYMGTSSYLNTATGDSDDYLSFIADTDGDGMYESGSNPDDYYYTEDSHYDAYDGETWSSTTLWDVPGQYYMATSNNSYPTGSFDSWLGFAADTDNDGTIEFWGQTDDYNYQEWSGFDADDLDSYASTQLWDIPGRYYLATSEWSNSGSGAFQNEMWFAADTDGDDNIENSMWSDDTYQHDRSGYDVVEDWTYSLSETTVDGNNLQDLYMWAEERHGSNASSGAFYNETEGRDLTGYYRNWDGYDVNYEDGPLSYNNQIAQVFGTDGYYAETHNWTFDAGDHGTWTKYNLDTDGDTAWNNTSDFEYESRSHDTYEGSEHNVGYWVDNEDTNYYEEYNQMFSGNGDTQYYYRDDAGDEAEMFLTYASGGTAPITGWLTVDNSDTYEWVWFDGGWSMLPYPIGISEL
jgi:hypothetical protein